MDSYLGESSEEPLTCSGDCAGGESPAPSDPSTLFSRSSSELLLSPKSSKLSSSPPMTVTSEWLWSSGFNENLQGHIRKVTVCVRLCKQQHDG